ncbi:UDP-N-acetylglucosamine 4,6-dehydratase (inverting) [Salidesulfovibrio brasiliensis]|uniref:UDP-N-acetylglucosamine 4,6-dehydratase (inverting) n=1 Tax=Salidesulfovibrio brasiliensis TaxID=221711 RepID=UPI0006CF585D|nr:UDP-N-acetylglucosamine 4,6-dehydratase (inverting) [Salidesulfovibrio brasiliensis]
MFNGKNILITGGTGSFGKAAIRIILQKYSPNKLIIFSRDELKQSEMREQFPASEHPCLRFFLGDIRDRSRLEEAFDEVDFVIHAAALKQVPAAEYNPFEFIKTNVLGSQNIIQAAIRCGVEKVIALSTDKAAAPLNLYGATKLCADKLFINGNQMSKKDGCKFSVVRYGNVLGSRGSVVPLFLEKRASGVLPVTDERMTRFTINLDDAIDFTLDKFKVMFGGELYVPKIPSYRILDVATAIAPEAKVDIVGIRPGEKLHECMITEDDARTAYEFDSYFVVLPNLTWYKYKTDIQEMGGTPCQEGFSYTSGNNTEWLNIEEISDLVDEYCATYGVERK